VLAGAPYLDATLNVPPSNTATVLATMPASLALPGEPGTIYDAHAFTVALQNGTSESISGIDVLLTDPSVPGATIKYSASAPSIAAGAGGTYYFPATSDGLLRDLALQLTFSSAPAAAGTVSAVVVVHGAGNA